MIFLFPFSNKYYLWEIFPFFHAYFRITQHEWMQFSHLLIFNSFNFSFTSKFISIVRMAYFNIVERIAFFHGENYMSLPPIVEPSIVERVHKIEKRSTSTIINHEQQFIQLNICKQQLAFRSWKDSIGRLHLCIER